MATRNTTTSVSFSFTGDEIEALLYLVENADEAAMGNDLGWEAGRVSDILDDLGAVIEEGN